jgi:hypothetical protein
MSFIKSGSVSVYADFMANLKESPLTGIYGFPSGSEIVTKAEKVSPLVRVIVVPETL